MKGIVHTLLIFAAAIHVRAQSETYGESIFLTIFGLDRPTTCQLCDHRESTQSSNGLSIREKIHVVITDELLHYHYEDHQWLLDHWYRVLYIIVAFAVFMLWIVLLKCRTKPKPRGTRENRKKITPQLPVKQDPNPTKIIRNDSTDDKLRKTKKQRSHAISKQGMGFSKKMKNLPKVSGSFDVIAQDSCEFVSTPCKEVSSRKLQVFGIRDRHYISENVMDALLCITPNCTKHPYHRIQKCGCQIVCNSEDTPDTVEQESSEMSVQILDNAAESNSENIQNDEDVVPSGESQSDHNVPSVLSDTNVDEEFGSPCASSSFINNSAAIRNAHNDSIVSDCAVFDAFSGLDETSSPNRSQLHRYVESRMTWFGGLYTHTRETSVTSFRYDGLDQNISGGLLDALDESFDVHETQKNLSLYGFETNSAFQFAAICFAKQVIGKLKQAFSAKKSKNENENSYYDYCDHCDYCDYSQIQTELEPTSDSAGYGRRLKE